MCPQGDAQTARQHVSILLEAIDAGTESCLAGTAFYHLFMLKHLRNLIQKINREPPSSSHLSTSRFLIPLKEPRYVYKLT